MDTLKASNQTSKLRQAYSIFSNSPIPQSSIEFIDRIYDADEDKIEQLIEEFLRFTDITDVYKLMIFADVIMAVIDRKTYKKLMQLGVEYDGEKYIRGRTGVLVVNESSSTKVQNIKYTEIADEATGTELSRSVRKEMK